MKEESRKKQEICRAILGETEQILSIVFKFKDNPVKLETPVYAKFEDQFWLLPDELSKSIRKTYSKISDANGLLGRTDNEAFFTRNDLWYNYLPADLIRLQEELRKHEYEALVSVPENDDNIQLKFTETTNMINQMEWDLFICHASEDKDEIARPLAELLRASKLKVWYDEFTLTIGDSLSRSIDKGLAKSRFGVVILSPSFFLKEWPRRELDGLTAKETSSGKTILPIWHKVDKQYVLRYSPILADKIAVSSDKGLEKVVNEIIRAIDPEGFQNSRIATVVYPNVPNVHISVFQMLKTSAGFYNFQLPKVGFELSTNSPIKLRVRMNIYLSDKELGLVDDKHGYYSGEMLWERGIGTFWGNFSIPSECKDSRDTLRLQAEVEITDSLNRTQTLVRCFTYDRNNNSWFPEPTSWQNLRNRAREKGYKL